MATLQLPKPKSESRKGTLSLISCEIYSGMEVPKKAFFVRLDGWAFHSLAKKYYLKKPFDKNFANHLVKTAKEFFPIFNPALAYIFSDEINFLFLKQTSFRRIEKIDSVFAGFASALFSKFIKQTAAFDCRVIPLGRMRIIKYLIWRQAEALRNHNNAWAQFVLIKKGLSARTASKKLIGLKTNQLKRLALEHGVDLDKTPRWQRNGILLYKESYSKKGWNPVEKKYIMVTRSRVKVDSAPLFKSREGKQYIKKIVE